MKSIFLLLLVLSSTAQASSLQYRNVPEPVKTKLEATLEFLKTIKADPGLRSNPATPLHQQVFGPMDGDNYLRWFEERVKRVGMDGCGGGTACAIFIMPTWIFLSSKFVSLNLSPIMQLAVLLHEARHNEHDHAGWTHEECPIPFRDASGTDIRSAFSGDLLQGLKACDSTEFGAYAAEYLFLSNVADHCVTCSANDRAEARRVADQTLLRMTDPRAFTALLQDRGAR